MSRRRLALCRGRCAAPSACSRTSTLCTTATRWFVFARSSSGRGAGAPRERVGPPPPAGPPGTTRPPLPPPRPSRPQTLYRKQRGLSVPLNWSLASDGLTTRGEAYRNAPVRELLEFAGPRAEVAVDAARAATVLAGPLAAAVPTAAFATDVMPGRKVMDVDEYEARLESVREARARDAARAGGLHRDEGGRAPPRRTRAGAAWASSQRGRGEVPAWLCRRPLPLWASALRPSPGHARARDSTLCPPARLCRWPLRPSPVPHPHRPPPPHTPRSCAPRCSRTRLASLWRTAPWASRARASCACAS